MNRLSQEELQQMGALGYADQMTAEQLAGMHIDGSSGLVFDTVEKYMDHVSPTTGYTPKDVSHQDVLTDGAFSRQADKAVERGEARKVEGGSVE